MATNMVAIFVLNKYLIVKRGFEIYVVTSCFYQLILVTLKWALLLYIIVCFLYPRDIVKYSNNSVA